MATTTQIEVSRDPTGLVTRTETKQSFTWENPAADCRSYRVNQVDGVVTITEEFFDETPTIWAVDISTTSEPLESHPEYQTSGTEKNNWNIWKTNPSLFPNTALDPEDWDPSTSSDPKIVSLFAYWSLGVVTYFSPRTVVKKTVIENSAPDTSLVGKIADPGYPGTTGSDNFILLGVSAQQEGEKYRTTYEYLGSPQGAPWDAGIYS